MIPDYENMFLDKKAASTYGTTAAYSDNVVGNGNGGSAYDPPFLQITVSEAATAGGNITVVLQTCDAEGFGSNVKDLATYYVPIGALGTVVKERIPYGGLKFYRLKLTGSASVTGNGKITAGFVTDVDLPL